MSKSRQTMYNNIRVEKRNIFQQKTKDQYDGTNYHIEFEERSI